MIGDMGLRERDVVARAPHEVFLCEQMAIDVIHQPLERAHQLFGPVIGHLDVVQQLMDGTVLLVDERVTGHQ